MGKLIDLAGWAERTIRNVRAAAKPTSFKAALKAGSGRMKEMADEVAVYKGDWRAIIVACLAKLAKMDDRSPSQEVVAAQCVLDALDFTPEERERAAMVFGFAKGGTLTFFEAVLAFKDLWEPEPQTKLIFLLCGFRVAYTSEPASEPILECLRDACRVLELSFDQCHGLFLECRESEKKQQQYYAVLGCSASDSDSTIKERYTALVKEFHPDRLASKELPSEILRLAEEKFRNIQSAYEAVTKSRKPSHS